MSLSPHDLRPALRLLALLLGCAGVSLLTGGCNQKEPITKYTVRKPELVDPTLVTKVGAPAAPTTPQQTLGLIVPVGDVSWFFKVTADNEVVEAQRETIEKFLASVKFSAGESPTPTWTLPEGWRQLPGSQFRYATIRLPESPSAAKPLEITVSTAGGDILSNINRWRGQLSLKPIAAADLASSTQAMEIDGRQATLVSLVGKGTGQMPGAPFAGGSGALPPDHPPTTGSAASAGSAATAKKGSASDDVRFTAPPEWSPGKASAFSVAAFKVSDGEKQAEITVSTAGGDFLANVNRWRGQLSLPPISAADLAQAAKKIETLGVSGNYVEINGPDSAAKRETILGVQAQAGGDTWFVKLRGDAELVQREKSRFEAFVKTLQLP
jgi:hypothetical protein